MNAPVALPPTLHVLERGWLSSNNIVFHDDDANGSVVDTGYVAHAAQTAALVEHALQGRALRRIVNTHLHSDHCGGNAQLQSTTGAQIVIPPGQAAAVAAWDEAALSYRATGQQCPRFRVGSVLAPGERITLGGWFWQALAAPGHDPHQLMLWCAPLRVLISADVLWENGFGAIFPEIDGEPGFAEQRAMLALVADLQPAAVIPGHGAPFAAVGAALARAQARLDALADDPERNARSIGRTLLKFHLLEVRATTLAALHAHFASARLARRLRDGYFPHLTLAALLELWVDDLVRIGAARRAGEHVFDAGPT